ncbi:hypothetical protein Goshw_011984, partial [Gossypium schwendimanii]|nr:hypothetical protein [Gossypium schwendimanii]
MVANFQLPGGILFVTILWSLLKTRNEKVFRVKLVLATQTLEYARKLKNDIHKAMQLTILRIVRGPMGIRFGASRLKLVLQTISESLGIPRLIVDLDAMLMVIEIRHILKEGNKCAVHLMNLAQVIDVGLVLLEAPPEDLLPFLQHDAC